MVNRPKKFYLMMSLLLLEICLFSLPSFSIQKSKHPFKIRDNLQREVVLPHQIKRILSLQPEITRILIALGQEKKLIGIDYFIHRYDHLYPLLKPRLRDLPLVSLSSESINLELLLRLKPDLIFTSPSETHLASSLQKKTGIPTLALSSQGRLTSLLEEIKVIGQWVNQEKRAAYLCGFFQDKIKMMASTLARTAPLQKPRVYLAFWSSLTRTPVDYEPVKVAGGINLAEELLPEDLGTVGTVVSVEKILAWNPDIILLHGNYLPEERKITPALVFQDKRLSAIRAVKNKQVYYTFGFWYWWDPAQVLVEIMYLAKIFHPEIFTRIDLEKEGNQVYQIFYSLPHGFTYLQQRLKWENGWSK
ncbi:MAG: ABC transporter substrate-binding protein [Candidatus Aminicenantes bacterium]|nr:ABC transporter substrate-binding protein [Candidatus Aminicenantes bacterium]